MMYLLLSTFSVRFVCFTLLIPVAGTDATMAEHIKKIQDRSYAALTPERTFTPTNLGLGLVDGLSSFPTSATQIFNTLIPPGYDAMGFNISLSKPHLRRELEAEMKEFAFHPPNYFEVVV